MIEIGGLVCETFARINPLRSSFTTAQTQMMQHDQQRVTAFIENPSSVTVYVSHLSNPTTTNAIVLAANGGSYTLNFRDDGEMVTLPIFGLTNSGTQTLWLMETILLTPWHDVQLILREMRGK